MNKNTSFEIIWLIAIAVTGVGAYFAFGIEKAFIALLERFGNSELTSNQSIPFIKLILLCVAPVAFLTYAARIVLQKGTNNSTLFFATAVLLVGILTMSDFKSFINIVGVDFKHFKFRLLGTGGNLFPEAARLMGWMSVGMGASGLFVAVNGYFLYRNFSGDKTNTPVKAEETDGEAPIDQVN